MTQPSNILNTQSQKTINLQRLGIQMPGQVSGLDPSSGIDFAQSTQHNKQLQPLAGSSSTGQVLNSQLI
jgi:hypothetical protein